MNKKVVVCGVGRMGQRHIKAAQSLGHSVVGFFDTSEESLAETLREFNFDTKTGFDDVSKMFSAVEADVCIVATTTPSHAALAITAMNAGCQHILIEKPVASSLNECAKIIRVAADTRSVVAVNHPYSEIALSKFIRDTVHETTFGGFSSCHIVGGNAGVAMNGIHFFDMFEFIANDQISQISARLVNQTDTNPRGPQYSDSSGVIDAMTASGSRLHIDISDDHGVGRYGIFMGKTASLQIDLLSGKYLLSIRNHETQHLPSTQYDAKTITSSGETAAIDIIALSALALERLLLNDPVSNLFDSERYLRYLIACHISSESGGNFVNPLGDLPQKRVFPWA